MTNRAQTLRNQQDQTFLLYFLVYNIVLLSVTKRSAAGILLLGWSDVAIFRVGLGVFVILCVALDGGVAVAGGLLGAARGCFQKTLELYVCLVQQLISFSMCI